MNTASSEEKQHLNNLYKLEKRSVFSVFVTGGGVQLISWLFTVPGSSRCVMNAGVPYSRFALEAFQGKGSQSCSAETARQMSLASYRDAAKCLLMESSDFNCFRDCNIFGVGCTAALISDKVSCTLNILLSFLSISINMNR